MFSRGPELSEQVQTTVAFEQWTCLSFAVYYSCERTHYKTSQCQCLFARCVDVMALLLAPVHNNSINSPTNILIPIVDEGNDCCHVEIF